MLKIEKITGTIDKTLLLGLIKRRVFDDQEAVAVASKIVDDVKCRGDKALIYYSHKFDNTKADEASGLRVEKSAIDFAQDFVSKEFMKALERAAENIAEFHRRALPESWQMDLDGTVVGQLVRPLNRIGAYVPGGQAAYPSTLLMTTIPAKVAGVAEIAVCCPPGPDGAIDPHTLAAARVAGVEEIYSIGGAQAIAAMAYGTDTVARVDKICGPGNIYVTLAKKLVIGDVGIDMLAGPSEVVIIADESANPGFIAADMLAQAEHDANASSYLITTSMAVAESVKKIIEKQLTDLSRAATARVSLTANGRIFVVEHIDDAIAISDRLAPEHLELCVENPKALLAKVKNAGAVFLGKYTPEALGDYLAGPNHVLPTAGTARFASPLGIDDFFKRTSLLEASKKSIDDAASDIILIANAEGLDAHARSAAIRIGEP